MQDENLEEKEIKELWNKYAQAGYEKFIKMNVGKGYANSLEKMLLPCPKGTVFDGGCGVGTHFQMILDKTKAEKLIAGDYSEVMIEKAKKTKETLKKELSDKIQIKHIDLTKNFPFQSEAFDAVIFQLSIIYLPHHGWSKAVKEAYRILKKGGYMYFVGQTKDFDFSKAVPKEITKEFIKHSIPTPDNLSFIKWMIKGGKTIAKIGKNKTIIFPTSGEFIDYCEKIGFAEVMLLDKPHEKILQGAGVAIRAKK